MMTALASIGASLHRPVCTDLGGVHAVKLVMRTLSALTAAQFVVHEVSQVALVAFG